MQVELVRKDLRAGGDRWDLAIVAVVAVHLRLLMELRAVQARSREEVMG
jgi:hypothetical protein